MRNLKRALSLALASVMLLGMMVVGTSAASYSDVSSEDNVEAIEVLNAVKVMIGKRGSFDPDAPVNRHEMATIMANCTWAARRLTTMLAPTPAITGATTNSAAANVVAGNNVTDTVNSIPADITVAVKAKV